MPRIKIGGDPWTFYRFSGMNGLPKTINAVITRHPHGTNTAATRNQHVNHKHVMSPETAALPCVDVEGIKIQNAFLLNH
ncbi:hypothetical protein DPMN_191645 [Dreissena polymorpha]|uniref:Uncharacterized protein n=1 Tax=Dreissena polymorpha TaxID=45954 RepID=A0A9D4BEG0_DREPO|nr:hypothetical protein DPMN_191645 [Dreissena polymorpha]